MNTEPATPPPRRKWHLQRWFLLAASLLAYAGWTQYAFRSALKEAKALRWTVEYTDPVEDIQRNWKAAFMKRTWLDGVTLVEIHTSEEFEQHLAIVHRLNPKRLDIFETARLPDVSTLKGLARLQWVSLERCTRLTDESIEALQAALPKTIINAQP